MHYREKLRLYRDKVHDLSEELFKAEGNRELDALWCAGAKLRDAALRMGELLEVLENAAQRANARPQSHENVEQIDPLIVRASE